MARKPTAASRSDGQLLSRASSSFYEDPRHEVAEALRSLVAFDSIVCVDPALLLRVIEVYETDRIDFAEAYLVACAERTGVGKVVSFDRSIDRIDRIHRVEPPRV